MKDRSALLVEDDPAASQYMAVVLAEEFDDLRAVPEGVAALLAMESRRSDLVVLDLRLPDMDGLEVLTQMRQRWPETPVILVTAAGEVATIVEAMQRGATNYLVKPVSPEILLASARKAVAFHADRPAHGSCAPEIVGASRVMIAVRHLLELAARGDASVLITGETGTGKELVARAIHRLSSHQETAFVAHNCGTTAPELFDSEFFGHRRGAFTGADRDHTGLLDKADGGILFLDELESLGPQQQAKLLRVLDDGQIRAVGASDAHFVCVRFLAATNREPANMVREGVLREDLYYRLRGFEIRIPPLRDRPEDIPALAHHFLGGTSGLLAPEALAALCAYSWPGNVRQLRNVLRVAGTLAGGRRIDRCHLGLGASGADRPRPVQSQAQIETSTPDDAHRLREFERQVILKTLGDFDGNRSRAARALGIDRSTLRRKLRQFGTHLSS